MDRALKWEVRAHSCVQLLPLAQVDAVNGWLYGACSD